MKCKWFGTTSNMGAKCGGPLPCPKNTNRSCNIIPRPPKRTVTVKKYKAWAIIFDDGTPLEAHTNKLADRLCGMNVTPCTITIDRKHLKG